MEFPLAARELTRSGKSKWTYVLRTVVLGLMFVVVLVVCGLSSLTPMGIDSVGETLGRSLAVATRFFQTIIIILLAPLFAAGLIAREKEERTLGLLILADFRGWDVFLAKLLSAFLQTELLLLSTLPILAFAAFFGGVSIPAVALRVFLLSVWAFAVCAVGLLFSTLSRRAVAAACWTLAIVALWNAAGPLLSRFGYRMPLQTVWNIGEAVRRADESGQATFYWVPSVALTAMVAAGAVLLGIVLLPRQVYERPRRDWARTTRSKLPRWRLLRMNPAAQLLASTGSGLSGSLHATWARLLIAAGLILLGLATSCLGPLIIVALLVYDITVSMASAQASHALDDIRLTLMDDRALGRAVLRAHLANTAIYIPAFVVTTFHSVFGWIFWELLEDMVIGSQFGTPFLASILLLWALMIVVDLVARFFCLLSVGSYAGTLRTTPFGETVTALVIVLGTGFVASVLPLIVFGMLIRYGMMRDLSGEFIESRLDDYAWLLVTCYIAWGALCRWLVAYLCYRGLLRRCRGIYLEPATTRPRKQVAASAAT